MQLYVGWRQSSEEYEAVTWEVEARAWGAGTLTAEQLHKWQTGAVTDYRKK